MTDICRPNAGWIFASPRLTSTTRSTPWSTLRIADLFSRWSTTSSTWSFSIFTMQATQPKSCSQTWPTNQRYTTENFRVSRSHFYFFFRFLVSLIISCWPNFRLLWINSTKNLTLTTYVLTSSSFAESFGLRWFQARSFHFFSKWKRHSLLHITSPALWRNV